MLLILIGLAAGIVTVITPCILPVLPVLLAGGASGRKPYRIIAGLVLSFVVFTLFATWILDEFGLPDDLLRNIAIVILFVLAATLIIPQFGLLLERPFSRLTRFRAGGGGFILGLSLGLVFTPCAGPFLAFFVSNAARHHFSARVIIGTIAYGVGAAIPMLVIASGGQRFAQKLRLHAPRVRVVSGVVIAAMAVAISFNLDTDLQTKVPAYASWVQNKLENSHAAQRALQSGNGGNKLLSTATTTTATTTPAQAGPGASNLPILAKAAPPIVAGGQWFNSKPITLASLRGKVVLVDFWTYSCINCLRTLPHLEAWYSTYHSHGLEIIGVHSPEFAFEHVASNVSAAVKRLGIKYPVVQDNNFATWNNYSNEYWPADYLIDQQGRIRAYSTGEGDYGEMEQNIQELLGVSSSAPAVPDLTPTDETTPESYLGYLRLDTTRYVGAPVVHNKSKNYPAKLTVPLNSLGYSGTWRVGDDLAVAGANAGLNIRFEGSDVYLVLGGKGKVTVSIDGKVTKTLDITAYKLYTLEHSAAPTKELMQLKFTPGVQAYAFTFG